MKNPLEKNNNSMLLAAVVLGGIAAAAVAYLYLTESGEELRGELKAKIKETIKDVASGAVSEKTGISKKTVKAAKDEVAE